MTLHLAGAKPKSLTFAEIDELDKINAFAFNLLVSAQKTSRSALIFTGAMTSLYYPMGGAVGALTVVGLCSCIQRVPAGSC